MQVFREGVRDPFRRFRKLSNPYGGVVYAHLIVGDELTDALLRRRGLLGERCRLVGRPRRTLLGAQVRVELSDGREVELFSYLLAPVAANPSLVVG